MLLDNNKNAKKIAQLRLLGCQSINKLKSQGQGHCLNPWCTKNDISISVVAGCLEQQSKSIPEGIDMW